MTKTSKKILMLIATVMILVFHVWIPIFGYGSLLGNTERFLISSSYIGVDIFFFLSGYSLSIKPVENYKEFVINRAIKILPFFVIAWALGHFMWFIPSLMLVYLIFPPLYTLCEKKPMSALPLLFVGWAVFTYSVMGFLELNDDIGIFLFRIPIIIIGAYAAKFDAKLSAKSNAGANVELSDAHNVGITKSNACTLKIAKFVIGLLFLAVGIYLTYRFGYINKLDFPFKGTFYLVGIPVTVGLTLLVSLIGEISSELLTALAGASLETYFMQMIIGSVLVNNIFSLTQNKLATNIIVMSIIVLLAVLISKIYPKIVKY